MLYPGLQPLLSEEATIRDQVKAAKAAEFDHKVQAGLEDIEPEPEAAEIKTSAPPAPTAAKACHLSSCYIKLKAVTLRAMILQGQSSLEIHLQRASMLCSMYRMTLAKNGNKDFFCPMSDHS